MPLAFDLNRPPLPDRFFAPAQPTPVPKPVLLAVNAPLAETLHLTPEELTSPSLASFLGGNALPDGSTPVALAYAGHQFGHFVPKLGDGRAILLGEVVGRDGRRYDVQLKGAGPTPFSRRGDGRAALGPVLREFLVSEAMHALGIPTTRALAAVATGQPVYREEIEPGAVLTRVASSHLRVGTFEYFAARRDTEALSLLVTNALRRHYPHVDPGERPALALLDAVLVAQASLVAKWLGIGFIHGVMNTDNTSISGETLDYGPCAFLDTYASDRTFSSIDSGGRYAYGRQPAILHWNLSRLADTLVSLVDPDDTKAVELLEKSLDSFGDVFENAYTNVMRKKLGLFERRDSDLTLVGELMARMGSNRVDFSLFFRRLADVAAGGDDSHVASLFADPTSFREWAVDWRARLAVEPKTPAERATLMRSVSPAFIPRNHRVEEMIDAARNGDLAPFERLRRVLARPYDEQPGEEELMQPPGAAEWGYRTFCGT